MENPYLRAALYFPRRMVLGVLTLLIVPTLIFGILQYAMSGETRYPPQMVERLGLDRPIWERYTEYLGGLLQGDLRSMITQQPVTVVIGERLPATLALMGLALFVTVLFSILIIVLGVLVLILRARVSIAGSILQRLGQLVVAIVTATPIFLVGMYLLWFFAVRLEWFPVRGLATLGSGRTFELKHAVLPVLTLAILPACLTARAVLGEIARFQSCPGYLVPRVAHAVLSFLENTLGQTVGVVGGMLLVEPLFSLPGIGHLAIQSAYNRDLLLLYGLFYSFAALALFLRGMASVVHGIDGFILPLLLAAERDVGKQSPTEKPRRGKILAWLWIGFCLLLILVPVARGALGIATGLEAALQTNLADRDQPPGSQSASGRTYAWGTDILGRDVRARALYALGVDLFTSFAVALAVSIPGLGLGLLSGALVRRRALWADLLDDVLMFPWDVLASWPGLVLLALVLALGEYSLLGLLIWLGLAFLLPRCVRMVRSAWASGLSHTGLWLRLAGVLAGTLAFAVGLAVVVQPALGFIGLGVPLPTPELGGMFAEGLRSFFTSPQTVLRPGLLLISAGVGWFLLADTVLSRCGVHTRGTWTAPNR